MKLASEGSAGQEQRMNGCVFRFAGSDLTAFASGALWWAAKRILVVSDLHLGKSDRIARRGGPMLPPYEVRDTLSRLENDIHHTCAETVICLGDSFDDLEAAEALTDQPKAWISRLQSGRRWIWIEGNHDDGPTALGGAHLPEFWVAPLTFRHIADPAKNAEISGHYHPKTTLRAKGQSITRACFLYDDVRVIMPAYGTYTGGLRSNDAALISVMKPPTMAILTGPNPVKFPIRS